MGRGISILFRIPILGRSTQCDPIPSTMVGGNNRNICRPMGLHIPPSWWRESLADRHDNERNIHDHIGIRRSISICHMAILDQKTELRKSHRTTGSRLRPTSCRFAMAPARCKAYSDARGPILTRDVRWTPLSRRKRMIVSLITV